MLQLKVSDGALSAERHRVGVVIPATAAGAPPQSDRVASRRRRLSQPVTSSGTVASADLLGWKLEHRLRGEGAWTRFASGTTPVIDRRLGQLDPTLLMNGIYEVRLTATDNAGRAAQASTIVVVRDNLKVGNFTVSFADLEVPVAGRRSASPGPTTAATSARATSATAGGSTSATCACRRPRRWASPGTAR